MSGKPTHGLSSLPEYRVWQTMRHRCLNPASHAFARYGGRGITICDRWRESPATFIADMGPRPTDRHEIDRIDNNAGYSPENCRWVLRSENDRNRRSNRHLTFRSETLTIAGWSERLGLRRDTIWKRLDGGWSVDDALAMPARSKVPNGLGPRFESAVA